MAMTRYVASTPHSGGQTAVIEFPVSDGMDLFLINAVPPYLGMPIAALCEGQLWVDCCR
jgi:hypothetical protein